MQTEEITITISPNGKVEAKTKGFNGPVCATALDELLGKALKVDRTEKTKEWWKKPKEEHHVGRSK
jgi:hypothetical protein